MSLWKFVTHTKSNMLKSDVQASIARWPNGGMLIAGELGL